YLRSLLAGTDEHPALVAVSDFQPWGVIGLISAASTTDGWWELGLLIEDRYQRQGVGNLLLGSLIDLLNPDEGLCATALFEKGWLLGKLARFGTVTSHIDQGIIHARVVRFGRNCPARGR